MYEGLRRPRTLEKKGLSSPAKGFNACFNTRFFFYKNILYKNIEAENPRKFKNILRIIRGSDQVGSNNSCKKAQCN